MNNNNQIIPNNLNDENIRQDGNFYQCLRCQKRLESIQVLKDHIEGKTHKKKNKSTTSQSSFYYCDTCKKKLNSQQQYDEHISGRNHNKKLSQITDLAQYFQEMILNNDIADDSFPKQNKSLPKPTVSEPRDISANISNLQTEYISEIVLDNDGKMTCFFCKLCKQVLPTLDKAKKHAQSKEHQQKTACEKKAPSQELPSFVPCQQANNTQTDNLTKIEAKRLAD